MSYENRLRGEIHAKIDELMSRGSELKAAWIAHEICHSHESAVEQNHEDADYWLWCGYRATREMVRRCLSQKIEPDILEEDRNLILPGFDHIQTHYMIRRDGEDIGVPIEQMTDEEGFAKAALYDRQAITQAEHANELRRYLRERSAMKIAG